MTVVHMTTLRMDLEHQNNEACFQKFVSLCKRVTGDDDEVLTLLNKRYQKASSRYVCSSDFPKLVADITAKIKGDPTNKYVFIKEFVSKLRASSGLKRKSAGDGDAESRPELKRIKAEHAASEMSSASDSEVECLKRLGQRVELDTDQHGASPGDAREVVNKNHTENGGMKSESSDQEESAAAASSARVYKMSCQLREGRSKSPDVERLAAKSPPASGVSEADAAAEEDQESEAESPLPSTSTKTDEEEDAGDDEGEDCESQEDAPFTMGQSRREKADNERHVQRLEKILKKLHNSIEKLEAKELDLDDLDKEDNTYLLLDRYKKKTMKVWNKICELKGCDTDTGRVTEKRFRFDGTRYPEINKKIQKFVNKYRMFPDFQDIRGVISLCNKKHHLSLGQKLLEELARDVFVQVGNKLQELRMDDFRANFGTHLTDNVRDRNDPAMYDPTLRRQLDTNRQTAKKKLDEVFDKYIHKQDMREQGESEEESNEDREDEVEDEEEDGEEDGEDEAEKSDENENDIGSDNEHEQVTSGPRRMKTQIVYDIAEAADDGDHVVETVSLDMSCSSPLMSDSTAKDIEVLESPANSQTSGGSREIQDSSVKSPKVDEIQILDCSVSSTFDVQIVDSPAKSTMADDIQILDSPVNSPGAEIIEDDEDSVSTGLSLTLVVPVSPLASDDPDKDGCSDSESPNSQDLSKTKTQDDSEEPDCQDLPKSATPDAEDRPKSVTPETQDSPESPCTRDLPETVTPLPEDLNKPPDSPGLQLSLSPDSQQSLSPDPQELPHHETSPSPELPQCTESQVSNSPEKSLNSADIEEVQGLNAESSGATDQPGSSPVAASDCDMEEKSETTTTATEKTLTNLSTTTTTTTTTEKHLTNLSDNTDKDATATSQDDNYCPFIMEVETPVETISDSDSDTAPATVDSAAAKNQEGIAVSNSRGTASENSSQPSESGNPEQKDSQEEATRSGSPALCKDEEMDTSMDIEIVDVKGAVGEAREKPSTTEDVEVITLNDSQEESDKDSRTASTPASEERSTADIVKDMCMTLLAERDDDFDKCLEKQVKALIQKNKIVKPGSKLKRPRAGKTGGEKSQQTTCTTSSSRNQQGASVKPTGSASQLKSSTRSPSPSTEGSKSSSITAPSATASKEDFVIEIDDEDDEVCKQNKVNGVDEDSGVAIVSVETEGRPLQVTAKRKVSDPEKSSDIVAKIPIPSKSGDMPLQISSYRSLSENIVHIVGDKPAEETTAVSGTCRKQLDFRSSSARASSPSLSRPGVACVKRKLPSSSLQPARTVVQPASTASSSPLRYGSPSHGVCTKYPPYREGRSKLKLPPQKKKLAKPSSEVIEIISSDSE